MSFTSRLAMRLPWALPLAFASTTAVAQPEALASVPIRRVFSFETVRLPQGEHMGLVGAGLLFDIGSGWSAGPAVYGAATGQRGGLFVLGAEAQRRWSLPAGFSLVTGAFVGGGGGGAAPVGSGLMLRPAVSVLKDIGPSLQAGVSWSHIRFPSGDIRSHQGGLVLVWRGDFLYHPEPGTVERGASAPMPEGEPTGLGFDRIQFTMGQYRLGDGHGRRIGLAGARAERRSRDSGIAWGMESAGAVSGGPAGYMEIFGTLALSTAAWPTQAPSWRVGARVAAGLAGGGAVPAGGGMLGKAAFTTELGLWPGWTVGMEVGAVQGATREMRGPYGQLWLGTDLEPGFSGPSRARDAGGSGSTPVEWVAAVQEHHRVLRQDGTHRAMGTVGLKLNRYVGEHLYLSGQAHSAWSGGAGAYAVGLVGAGLATTHAASLRTGAELLVGAAGGGGVEIGSGALAQAMWWVGWNPGRTGEWRLGLGQMRAFRPGWHTPVVELNWSRAFGVSTP